MDSTTGSVPGTLDWKDMKILFVSLVSSAIAAAAATCTDGTFNLDKFKTAALTAAAAVALQVLQRFTADNSKQ